MNTWYSDDAYDLWWFSGVDPACAVVSSNSNGAPDLRRALSLLSSDSWGPADVQAGSQVHPGGVMPPLAVAAATVTAPTNPVSVMHALHPSTGGGGFWQDGDDPPPLDHASQAQAFMHPGNGSSSGYGHLHWFCCIYLERVDDWLLRSWSYPVSDGLWIIWGRIVLQPQDLLFLFLKPNHQDICHWMRSVHDHEMICFVPQNLTYLLLVWGMSWDRFVCCSFRKLF